MHQHQLAKSTAIITLPLTSISICLGFDSEAGKRAAAHITKLPKKFEGGGCPAQGKGLLAWPSWELPPLERLFLYAAIAHHIELVVGLVRIALCVHPDGHNQGLDVDRAPRVFGRGPTPAPLVPANIPAVPGRCDVPLGRRSQAPEHGESGCFDGSGAREPVKDAAQCVGRSSRCLAWRAPGLEKSLGVAGGRGEPLGGGLERGQLDPRRSRARLSENQLLGKPGGALCPNFVDNSVVECFACRAHCTFKGGLHRTVSKDKPYCIAVLGRT